MLPKRRSELSKPEDIRSEIYSVWSGKLSSVDSVIEHMVWLMLAGGCLEFRLTPDLRGTIPWSRSTNAEAVRPPSLPLLPRQARSPTARGVAWRRRLSVSDICCCGGSEGGTAHRSASGMVAQARYHSRCVSDAAGLAAIGASTLGLPCKGICHYFRIGRYKRKRDSALSSLGINLVWWLGMSATGR